MLPERRALIRLAELIRTRRAERRSRWRKLDPARQALLVLAHLRNGDTYARLAGGLAIGATTAWRYIREAVDLLAALADDVTPPSSERPGWPTLSWTAPSFPSTASPTSGRTTAANTSSTE